MGCDCSRAENIRETYLANFPALTKFVLFRFRFVVIRDDPYWTSRKSSLELIELSSINKVSLVQVFSCSNTGSIRDAPYWTSRKNSLDFRTAKPTLYKSS